MGGGGGVANDTKQTEFRRKRGVKKIIEDNRRSKKVTRRGTLVFNRIFVCNQRNISVCVCV